MFSMVAIAKTTRHPYRIMDGAAGLRTVVRYYQRYATFPYTNAPWEPNGELLG